MPKPAVVYGAVAIGLFVLAIITLLTGLIYSYVVEDAETLSELPIGLLLLVMLPSVIGLFGSLYTYLRLSRKA